MNKDTKLNPDELKEKLEWHKKVQTFRSVSYEQKLVLWRKNIKQLKDASDYLIYPLKYEYPFAEEVEEALWYDGTMQKHEGKDFIHILPNPNDIKQIEQFHLWLIEIYGVSSENARTVLENKLEGMKRFKYKVDHVNNTIESSKERVKYTGIGDFYTACYTGSNYRISNDPSDINVPFLDPGSIKYYAYWATGHEQRLRQFIKGYESQIYIEEAEELLEFLLNDGAKQLNGTKIDEVTELKNATQKISLLCELGVTKFLQTKENRPARDQLTVLLVSLFGGDADTYRKNLEEVIKTADSKVAGKSYPMNQRNRKALNKIYDLIDYQPPNPLPIKKIFY